MIRSAAVVAAFAFVLTASACSSSHGQAAANGSAAASAVAAPPAGTATLTVDAKAQALTIKACTDTIGGGVNMTASGPGSPPSSVIVNLSSPLSSSSLVWTTFQAASGYTTYELVADKTNVLAGHRSGSQLVLSGQATEQPRTSTGAAIGAPKKLPVSLNAMCSAITPLQAAASASHSTTT
jgi:hypothetical protein